MGSSNFNQYSKSGFGDPEQVELKAFCDRLTGRGCHLMLSNSDSTNEDGTSYFETLYNGFNFNKLLAQRNISVDAKKRKKQSEGLISNYDKPKAELPSMFERWKVTLLYENILLKTTNSAIFFVPLQSKWNLWHMNSTKALRIPVGGMYQEWQHIMDLVEEDTAKSLEALASEKEWRIIQPQEAINYGFEELVGWSVP